MATTSLEMPIDTSCVAALTAKFEAMQAYFDTAPDDDPVKVEMAAFGVVDTNKHFNVGTKLEGGKVVVSITPIPELKRIMDMVPV